MSNLDRLTEEAATKAALAVGRDAAKRAVDKLLTGEKSAASTEDEAPASKSRRWKIIVAIALGLCLVVGVLGLLLSYWVYFLFAGILGVGALVGWSRLKKRMAARKLTKDTMASKPTAKQHTPALESARVRVDAPPAAPAAPDALEEAHALREQEVDAELAAMKARLKR